MNKISKVIIILFSIILIIVVAAFCIFLFNFFRTDGSRILIVDNDEYISGNYSKRECGDIAQNFFPSYESVADKAEFEYRYFTLGDKAKLHSSAYEHSRSFRSLFMLELVFENTEDYFNIINQTTNGQSLQKIEKHSEKGYYMYNISSYSDFPNRLAYTVCNDEMKTVTYLLMVDTAYKLESDAIVFFDMSLPSEWYIYKDNDLKERCMYTLYQYKVPTGSIAFGEINIVEEDEYGRILYEVPVSGVMTSEKECQNMCVYLVCQKYDENTVWYYDSECMVISKQLGLNVRKELNKLKKNNDWETEIDISKCTSRKVMSSYFEKNVEFDESKLEGLLFENMEEKTVVYDVCDKDQNGRMLVFVREKSYDSDGNLQLGVPFVMVIEEDDNSDYKIVSDGKVQMNGIKDLQAVESVKRKTFWNNTVND